MLTDDVTMVPALTDPLSAHAGMLRGCKFFEPLDGTASIFSLGVVPPPLGGSPLEWSPGVGESMRSNMFLFGGFTAGGGFEGEENIDSCLK